MALRHNIIFVCICTFLHFSYGQVRVENGTLHVQIGTTSNCPDVTSLMRQLGPVYDKYKEFLDIEFIPWGRSSRNTNGELICQYGAMGCWANRYHRCVLSMLENIDSKIKFMECEYSDARPGYSGSYLCATEVGLRLVEVDNCMATGGGALEAAAEAATAEPLRVINYIPFVVFNSEISREVSDQVTRNQRLESVVCFALAEDITTGVTHCKI